MTATDVRKLIKDKGFAPDSSGKNFIRGSEKIYYPTCACAGSWAYYNNNRQLQTFPHQSVTSIYNYVAEYL